MAEDYKVDAQGGEYRVVEGQEMRAVWVPLSAADKEALVKKATTEGKAVGLLVAGFLKSYLKGGASSELSMEDLEQVAGGVMTAGVGPQQIGKLYPSLVRGGFLQPVSPGVKFDPGKMGHTTMCPW